MTFDSGKGVRMWLLNLLIEGARKMKEKTRTP